MGLLTTTNLSPPSSPLTPLSPGSLPVWVTLRNRRRARVITIAVCAFFLLTASWTLYHLEMLAPAGATSWRPNWGRGGEEVVVVGNTNSLLPPKIWQIMLPKDDVKKEVDPEKLKDSTTWLAGNIDYQYQLIGPAYAEHFLQKHYASRPEIIETYRSLPNLGQKSDLLRYLILQAEGGVYTDIDTTLIRPVSTWIPEEIRDQVRLIVGIEFDKLDGPNWADIPHDLQFCQWTIAAAPSHPVFSNMVDRILSSMKDISHAHGDKPIDKIYPSSFEVMNSTGPAAWTDVVFSQLQQHDSSLNETKDLSGMTSPRLYGDILVLPIDGFGMGQIHSHSTNDGSTPEGALVKHNFWGSWREAEKAERMKKEEEEERRGREELERKKKEEEEMEMKKKEKEELEKVAEAVRLAMNGGKQGGKKKAMRRGVRGEA